ncbi:MAG: hypothetical protein PV358_16125, partial [Acidimicrobiales bacterium]|nr:hypothetical protein [Acidimicrobiales bacterium]
MAEAELAAAWGRTPTDAEIVGHWQAMVAENRPRLAPPADPDLIYPGQVFVAPPAPAPADVTATSPAAPAPAPETPAVPDAAPVPEAAPEAEAPSDPGAEAPGVPDSPSLPDAEAPAGPTDEIDPLDIDEAPPIDGAEAEADADADVPGEADVPAGPREPAGGVPTAPAGSARAAGEPTDESPGDADESGIDDIAGVPVGVVGGGLAVAGVLVLLERRRRAQQRHRRPGRVVPLPPPHLRDRERELRWGADIDGARLLDTALRAAAAEAGATGLPRLRWAEARPDSTVLVLAEPSPAPAGFVAADPARWMTGASLEELALAAAHAAAPIPTLTPVGTTEDGAELLLELESHGVTTVSGPADDVTGLLRAMVVAASTAIWSDQVRVVAVGLDHDLVRLPGVESVPTLAEALDRAEAHATRTEAALRALRGPSIAQARAVGATPEAWDPLLIVAAMAPGDRSDLRRLEALSERPNSAVGLVTLPGIQPGPGVRSLAIGAHGWLEIEDVAEPVRPRYLGASDVRGLVDLLESASRLGDEEPDASVIAFSPRRPSAPPPPVGSAPATPSTPAPPAVAPPDPDVEPALDHAAYAPPALQTLSPTPDLPPTPDRPPTLNTDPLPPDHAPPTAVPAPAPAPPSAPVLRARDLLGEVAVLVRVLGEVEAVRLDDTDGTLRETRLVPTRQRALET